MVFQQSTAICPNSHVLEPKSTGLWRITTKLDRSHVLQSSKSTAHPPSASEHPLPSMQLVHTQLEAIALPSSKEQWVADGEMVLLSVKADKQPRSPAVVC